MQETEMLLTPERMLALLRWAKGKTRTTEAAEDLAQEVLLQWLQAMRKQQALGAQVLEPEHLLWRVARFVWCKSLRSAPTYRCEMIPETLSSGTTPEESAQERDEVARQKHFVRRQVMRLSKIQREVLVLHYIEQLSTAQIASRLQLSEGTVRWHLSDSRKKIREAKNMMNEQEFVHRPQKMTFGTNGWMPDVSLLDRLDEDLLSQNVLFLCYQEGKTAQELCDMLGVARPYVESTIAFLMRAEMLMEKAGKYYTTFMMTTQAQREERLCLYVKHQDELSRVIIRRLQEKEKEIRAIGFVGAQRPMNQLLWWLIYHMQFLVLPGSECPERPIHPDGGKYHLMGYLHETAPKWSGWDYNGWMYSGGFYWLGLYNFGMSKIRKLFDDESAQATLLTRLIEQGFAEDCVMKSEKETLAQLVQEGFLFVQGEKIVPNFCILTAKQYAQLQENVFCPIAKEIQPAYVALEQEMRALCQKTLPTQLQGIVDLPLHMAMLDLHYMTAQIAFADGVLYQPETPEEGAFLTLVYAPSAEEELKKF